MSLKAAIDIGTNTVLLLVAELEGGKLQPRLELQSIPRLGRRVDAERNLSADGMQNVIRILNDYSKAIRTEFGKIPVIVTATSAVRDARNRDAFLARIKEETGFDVRLLSGDDEAECTFTGAIAPLKLPSGNSIMVLDIGGGSTELAAGFPGKMDQAVSVDMGSVRFSERYFKNDPPHNDEVDACRRAVIQSLNHANVSPFKGMDNLVAVAGTATTIASILIDFTNPVNRLINGMTISRSELQNISSRLIPLDSSQILNLNPDVMKGREDIILAGILILEGVMDHFGFDRFLVSAGGIRHGAILKDW